jgi:hypothetical protein
MLNISFNGENVFLKEEVAYYLIDALYVMDIKEKVINPSIDDLEDELRKVFPYTRTPFGKYLAETIDFSISRIKKVGYDEPQINATQFSCDTGLLLIIAANLLVEFSAKFDYYELVDSTHDIINKSFWKDLTQNYNFSDVALVLAPGAYSGFDFEGSGQYAIQ